MSGSGIVDDDLDQTNPHAVLAKARAELAAGDEKQAARLLTDAAYQTRDPEIERQVRDLAAQGLERSGRFGKRRWNEIIRIVDDLQSLRSHDRPPLASA